MSEQSPYTDDEVADAATTALLRMVERQGVSRQVLSELSPADRAAVFAAEARNRDRRK